MKIKEYFKDKIEEMPKWLEEYKIGNNLDFKEILKHRYLLYPGAFTDGNPLGLINNSKYLHTYIYCDIGTKVSNIKEELKKDNAFYGYNLLDIVDIKNEKELVPNGWHQHYKPSKEYIDSVRDWIKYVGADIYGLVAIYERKEEFDETHGLKRFCLIYLGADATATYDALVLNKYYHAPNIVYLQDNMGGDSASFSRGCPLEEVANMTKDMPEYLLLYCNYLGAWDNYHRLYNVEPAFKGKTKVYLCQKNAWSKRNH